MISNKKRKQECRFCDDVISKDEIEKGYCSKCKRYGIIIDYLEDFLEKRKNDKQNKRTK